MSGKGIQSEFIGTNSPFTVIGYFPSRNLVSAGCSLSAVSLNDRLTGTLSYYGCYGKKYADNSISGQIGLNF
jgi:hypothetical protein